MHKQHQSRNIRNKGSNKRNVSVGPVQTADSLLVRLRYPIAGTIAAAATVISKRYTPNGAYDVDPVLGSTATPGFAEYAALYSYYRVSHYNLNITFTNLDNLSVALYTVNTNTDPGTAGTNYYLYAQSALGRTMELAPFYSGKGTARLRQRVDVSKILGMTPAQADSFRSVTTSIPTDLVYFGFGIKSVAGTNFSNGIGFAGYIEMDVKFYARNELLISYFRPSGVEWEATRQIWKNRRVLNMPIEQDDDREQAFHKAVEAEMTKQLLNETKPKGSCEG
jgi:hypothetical protein